MQSPIEIAAVTSSLVRINVMDKGSTLAARDQRIKSGAAKLFQ
jgi:hypothetical protein